MISNENLTIEINYYDNGQIYWVKTINKDGQLHNPDGPAYQEFYKDGSLWYQSFWLNAQLHRSDGPAHQWFYNDGSLRNQEFWLNNEELTKEEFLRRTQKSDPVLNG